MSPTVADHAPTGIPSPGLAHLADPEVRCLARRLLHVGEPAELVAAEIGVTVAELASALRPGRRQTAR
jgi:hypothetical protein